MSTLTKNEREGLEDVFLSIHTNKNKYIKLKQISSLIMSHSTTINVLELLKEAKQGLKEAKISHFVSNLSQKKKNLSK
jgi:hypothetical protein